MEVFSLTLRQMLVMFSLILVGFLLRKKSILPDNAGRVMAKMETFIFVPALSLFTQMTKCTVRSFAENAHLILWGFVIVLAAVALAYLVSPLFIRNAKGSSELMYQRNIYRYALTFGNYGWYVEMYIGLFLLAPFLNIILEKLDSPRQYLWFLGTMLFLTALTSITPINLIPDYWTSLYPLTLYVVGAGIRRYRPNVPGWLAALLTVGRSFSVGGSPGHSGVQSSLPGPHHDVSKPPRHDHQRCPQTLPSVPWGAELSQLRTTVLNHTAELIKSYGA